MEVVIAIANVWDLNIVKELEDAIYVDFLSLLNHCNVKLCMKTTRVFSQRFACNKQGNGTEYF